MSEAVASVLLALADDELVLGHRHSEWTGFAPHIEEDVAFSSIAQDEIGHAAALYALVAGMSGGDPDQIALGRSADEYRHAVLCERENGDWAFTLARHWFYDHADAVRLESLERSSHQELSALVTKMRREERYHLLHADAWLRRIAHGPVEGRTRLIAALADVYPDVLGLFEPFEREEQALEEGALPEPSKELGERFLEATARALDDLGLPTEAYSKVDERAEFVASSSGDLIAASGDGAARPQPAAGDGFGGRRGRHSDAFQRLWDVMTGQYRAHRGATW